MNISLNAQVREHKGKGLRNKAASEGKVPAVVYGQDIDNQLLFVESKDISKILQENGTSQLVNLKVNNDEYKVMIREVQNSPVSKQLLHLDFLKVNLKELIKTIVPVRLEGEPEGLKKGGTLQQHIWEVEVECLPDNMPEAMTADVSDLKLDDGISISALTAIAGVEVLTAADNIVATLVPARVGAAEEEVDGEEEGK
ncbi:LSU ribosomal protein L25P [Desulfonispora thiosulfatigenes DSM 11270]|uniref:Large ribosomal subunit protein bL25 n=1 Tax=Desulfonispora thiosulfatigenes DSM 11270 TaxID=656914 RepID=A0A1W1V164_DESTI|nr:50S ribosomal protein L25 [Desulfonispora thiosulfatigenes]SMB87073.1 LSU ribosomal protein L25P [Desulfonispora thiosulfatigenes DSM 11270]